MPSFKPEQVVKSFALRIKLALLSLTSLFIISLHPPVHAQSATTIFAVIGDYGTPGQAEADVASLVKSWSPDFIVTTGDNNQNSRTTILDDAVGQYYHEYLYNYNGKYGAGSPTRRFYPSIGNHDWAGDGVNSYLEYFRLRDFQRYYDFVQGPVHFFILDSDGNEPDGVMSNSQQAHWLKKVLTASTSPFDVVIFHHPPYSSGKHGSSEYMRWPFKEWGADVILSGHNHLYERLLVDGIPYFVNGLGGAEIYNFETILAESQIRFNQDHGAMRVEATNTTMKLQMFTRTGILVDQYVIGKTIPLVSSLTRVNPGPTNTAIVDYLVTFSEPVTGVDPSDFTLSTVNINDAFISAINGTGSSYLVSINSGTSDGSLQLKLTDNDSITNEAGNPLGGNGNGNGDFLNADTVVIDKTAPGILAITRVNINPTNTFSVDYFVSFTEPVNGVDGSDFGLFSSNPSGAYISNVSGSGKDYIISVNTGSGDTSLRLDLLDNDSITDAVGNPTDGNFTNGEIYNIDKSTPLVTSIIRTNTSPTNSASVDFIVTLSEPVTGLDATDFTLATNGINGAYVSNIVNSNPFYVVTVNTGNGDGAIRLDLIDDDSIVNSFGTSLGNSGAGNGNFSSGESYAIDKTAPIATSIQRASTDPVTQASVDFIVTFSESVAGVDSTDFVSTVTNINGASIGNIVNANPFYVVSVNTGSGSGTLRLDITDNDSITDAAGNSLGSVGIGNGNFIIGETFTVKKETVNFPAPILLEPRRNLLTNNSQPSFSWTIVRNASAYELVVGLDEGFSQVVLAQIVNKPPFTFSSPLADGYYFWKVRAYNGDLLPGKFSGTQVLTIDRTPPAPPVPVSPPDNSAAPRRPWLQWNSVSDATQFQIQVDNNADFVSPEFKGSSNKMYIRAENLPKGTYFWRITARDAAGNWGTWSATYSFSIP